ncbi:hypothetical protein M378DRAFT_183521 [Amanita muscaria Koide BX008]|uniref:non-specific serine/threonine protein kinase n=1 Tax=Amanita muscaria (strain Koide BX008) TaxID=946122 RepID=A0A0C2TUM1_AMAMK|nr:hypothetical protein M378DRAFT_183521 [Amanita muscaria Koide BX008]
MAHKKPCAKYQYVVTPSGPKILPVDEPSCKDEESPADYNAGGYLPIKVNDTFRNNRYRIVRKLGWGHFSTVWLVKDTHMQRHSALKVVKSAGRYAETARDEIMLLSRVQSFSPDHPGRCHIVSFTDSFTHQGPESTHICIVFEPLGENLLGLIERYKKKGVPRSLVRVIAKQILLGLEYLHDECDLVHTDIKPENILICIPEIEIHIQNELSRSPSPTSRRVGVPLPTKTRSGVTIPQLHQRPRRQVQIFDSQPLSSPSRSLARSCYSSFGSSVHPSVVGRSGTTASFGSPLVSCSALASNLVASITSPKAPCNLSTSTFSSKKSGTEYPGHPETSSLQPKAISDYPPSSSSSSSSSIVSLGASTATGSSNISTPPTSLPQSLTYTAFSNAIAIQNTSQECCPRSSELCQTRVNLRDPKGKTRAGPEYDAGNDLHQTTLDSGGLGKAIKPSVNTDDIKWFGHSRSQSGTSATTTGFWKDPGSAALAPAVVVSAVVGAAGADGDCLQLSNTSVQEVADTTAPTNNKVQVALKSKSHSLLHGVHSIITTNLHRSKTHASGPSLLTQTAPSRHSLVPEGHETSRPSFSRHPSHLSAHMHKRRSPSCRCTDPEHKHRAVTDGHRRDAKSRTLTSKDDDQRAAVYNSDKFPAIDSASTSITPTPALPPPAPPTTPCEEGRFTYDTGSPQTERDEKGNPDISILPPPILVKIADLGNATPCTKHYTDDIQTRQYRSPEAILGRSDWDARVDMWSVACLVFELLTGEYLFDPQGQGELFTKDDDHMAQIIELVGDFPVEVKMGGKYSREIFDHTGALRYIRALRFWPLKRVMVEKYLYSEQESTALCKFLEPMLATDMRQRAHASYMKNHKWLEPCDADETNAE